MSSFSTACSSSSSGQGFSNYQAFSEQLSQDCKHIAKESRALLIHTSTTEPFKRVREFALNINSEAPNSAEDITLKFSLEKYINLLLNAEKLGHRHVTVLKSSVKERIAQFELIECPFQGMDAERRKIAKEKSKENDLFTKEAQNRFAIFLFNLDKIEKLFPENEVKLAEESDNESNDETDDEDCCSTLENLNSIFSLIPHMYPQDVLEDIATVDLSRYITEQCSLFSNTEILDALELTEDVPQIYPGLIDLQIRLYDTFKIPDSFLKQDYDCWVTLQINLLKDKELMNAVLDWKKYSLEKRGEIVKKFIEHYSKTYGIASPKVVLIPSGDESKVGYNTAHDFLIICPRMLAKIDFGTTMGLIFHEMTHCRQNKLLDTDQQPEHILLANLFQFNDFKYIFSSKCGLINYSIQPIEVQAYANQLRMVNFFYKKMLPNLQPSDQSNQVRELYQVLQKRVDLGRYHRLGYKFYSLCDDVEKIDLPLSSINPTINNEIQLLGMILIKELLGLDYTNQEDVDAINIILRFHPTSAELDLENSSPSRRQLKWLKEAQKAN